MQKQTDIHGYQKYYYSHYGLFFPLLVLFIGLWWLAKDQGWIQTNITIWPILLIILGVYLLLKRTFVR